MSRLAAKFPPGSNARIIAMIVGALALLSGSVASFVVGLKAWKKLRDRAIPESEKNQALPFLTLLGILLAMVGVVLGILGINEIGMKRTGAYLFE